MISCTYAALSVLAFICVGSLIYFLFFFRGGFFVSGGNLPKTVLCTSENCGACKKYGPDIIKKLKELGIKYEHYDVNKQRSELQQIHKLHYGSDKKTIKFVPSILPAKGDIAKLKSVDILKSYLA